MIFCFIIIYLSTILIDVYHLLYVLNLIFLIIILLYFFVIYL